jgi:tetratricopeptide (TPR) repeat protein
MKKWLSIFLLAAAASVSLSQAAGAAAPAPMTLSFDLNGSVTFPAFGSEAIFAGSVPPVFGLRGSLTLPGLSFLPFMVEIAGTFGLNPHDSPTPSLVTNLAVGTLLLGAGIQWDVVPWLTLWSDALFGMYYGMGAAYSGTTRISGLGPALAVDAGIKFNAGQYFSFGLGGAYRVSLGVLQTFGIGGTVTLHVPLDGGAARAAPIEPAPSTDAPKPEALKTEPAAMTAEWLGIGAMVFDSIFPVFYKYYETHPIGSVALKNNRDTPMQNLKASVWINKFMDTPKQISGPAELKPGEERKLDLTALFNDTVLEVTEPTKVAIEVSFTYQIGGQSYQQKKTDTVQLLDRNSLTWDPDEKVCAFVSARDPSVLAFAKNMNALAKSRGTSSVNDKLLTAMAIHEGLSQFGIAYVTDPKAPYSESVKNRQAIDFLQYPRQTLEYKSGDCDDLSVLYNSLLQSVAIDTAFITVPGHIYIAFSIDMTPAEARKAFQRVDDLIFLSDSTWIPLEITDRSGGFVQAWQTGAREWRESSSRQQAYFFEVRNGWKTYEPVGLPGQGSAIAVPSSDKVAAAFQAQVRKFVDGEIATTLAKLQADIKKQGETPRLLNQLGVMYARYALYDEAERNLQKAVTKEEYVPALLNLGNIAFTRKNMDLALGFYDRAAKKQPDNANVLLAQARVNHAMENYGSVARTYARLKQVAPDLAQQFAYLDLRGAEATRAAEISSANEAVIWVQE